jgi:hypothetical protein
MMSQISDQDKSIVLEEKGEEEDAQELFHKKNSFQYGGLGPEI